MPLFSSSSSLILLDWIQTLKHENMYKHAYLSQYYLNN